jgi:hypothetical protein
MISDTGMHSWGDAQCLMDAAEVVMHVVESESRNAVLDLLRKGISQPSESPHLYPHGEILALDVASASSH